MANQNYAAMAPVARNAARMADYNKYKGKVNQYTAQRNALQPVYNGAVMHLGNLNNALMNAVLNHGAGSAQHVLAQQQLAVNTANIANILGQYNQLTTKINNNIAKRLLSIT